METDERLYEYMRNLSSRNAGGSQSNSNEHDGPVKDHERHLVPRPPTSTGNALLLQPQTLKWTKERTPIKTAHELNRTRKRTNELVLDGIPRRSPPLSDGFDDSGQCCAEYNGFYDTFIALLQIINSTGLRFHWLVTVVLDDRRIDQDLRISGSTFGAGTEATDANLLLISAAD
ncbi:hypothetical protein SRHO_G00255680 [Serrasalmus rhombeus]